MSDEATLRNDENYTIFKYGKHIIRFLAPYSLEYYTEVKEWDNGYLFVMAKYSHNNKAEEEYIDFIKVADEADMLINGYAFTKESNCI